MEPIKISDARLDAFYSQNPEFDILTFNFFSNQTDTLNWEDIDQDTTLDLLKQYQRLLRIEPDPAIAETLLTGSEVSLDSANAIASLTEAQFIKLLPEDKAVAKQMYPKAIDIKARTQLLWANMKDAIASPHYRSMQVSATQDNDKDALSHDIPSYQDIFGDLDYFDCDHCNSVLSPAAYVVDLMQIVDQYITEPNQDSIHQAGGLTLNQRRPDLAAIELTCENTNGLVPALQIINRILEARVKAALESEDALQFLATEQYPFNLPFNYPLEQIRSYLGYLKTDLGTIYKTFDLSELAIAREQIGLSLEDYDLITNSKTEEAELEELYQIDNLDDLNDVEVFLQQTGLLRPELSELIEQNLHDTELAAGLAHTFYINQGLDGNQAVRLTPIVLEDSGAGASQAIENLTPGTLDRIHRFIRLGQKLTWSFTDLDWVLTSIGATEIDAAAIKEIATIKQFQTQYKLPLDVLCSFWHDMKTVGIGSDLETSHALFDRVFNVPFQDILGETFFRLQDDIQQIDLNNLDQEVENNPSVGRVLAALQLNITQLTDILQVLWEGENTVDLTVGNLSQLFRVSQMLRLLSLDIEEYQVLASFLDIQSIGTVSIEQFSQITELAQWLKDYRLKVDELNYILTGQLSSDLDIGYSEADVIEGMTSLWQLAANSLLRPSDFVIEDIDEAKAVAIFEQLLSNNYVEDVTSDYERILEIPLENKIAIVVNSDFTDDAEFIQEITPIINAGDDNQLNKQISSIQAILKNAGSSVLVMPDFPLNQLNCTAGRDHRACRSSNLNKSPHGCHRG